MGHHAEQVQGVGMRGIAVDENLVDPRRLVQEALLMITQGCAQIVSHRGYTTCSVGNCHIRNEVQVASKGVRNGRFPVYTGEGVGRSPFRQHGGGFAGSDTM